MITRAYLVRVVLVALVISILVNVVASALWQDEIETAAPKPVAVPHYTRPPAVIYAEPGKPARFCLEHYVITPRVGEPRKPLLELECFD